MDRLSALIVDYVTRTRQMPPTDAIEQVIKGKIVLQKENLSPVVVNSDLKIVLPYYNEMQVPLGPLPLTVYLLFLLHPEGIVLSEVCDYRRQLEEIYSFVMPGRDDDKLQNIIDGLIDTTSGLLNQKIAVIKRAFKAKIVNDGLASRYYIKGRRGQAYRIDVPSSMITLPAAIKSLA